MSDAAGRGDHDPSAGPVSEDEEAPDRTTVWRAGHERVATGPLRAQGDNVYNPEDEPLQAVSDRPDRTTRGVPASDGAGISSPDGAATTGSATRSGDGPVKRGRNPRGRVEPERDN